MKPKSKVRVKAREWWLQGGRIYESKDSTNFCYLSRFELVHVREVRPRKKDKR